LRNNILEVFSIIKKDIWKAALPWDSAKIFRWGHIAGEDDVSRFFYCFGSPLSLSWYSAKQLRLI